MQLRPDVDGHDHAQVGVHVLELLGDDARGSRSPCPRRRTPRGCRSRAGAGRPCPSGSRARTGARGRGRGSSARPRCPPSRGPSSRRPGALRSSSNESMSASSRDSVRIPGVFGQRLGMVEQRGGPRPACSFGTSTRTTEKERTLGSGSWLKVWSTHLGLDAGLAQPQRDQLRLVDLRGLRDLVPAAVGAAVDSSSRSPAISGPSRPACACP